MDVGYGTREGEGESEVIGESVCSVVVYISSEVDQWVHKKEEKKWREGVTLLDTGVDRDGI